MNEEKSYGEIAKAAKKAKAKNKLKKKFGEECVYCECNNKLTLTLDHIVPLARGGEDTDNNKQVTCFVCNQLKGGLTDKEFKKYLKALYVLKDLCKLRLGQAIPSLVFSAHHYPDFAIPKEEEKK